MSISVIIVNYNSDQLLTKCLENLNRQTILPEQIIVVDNASTDGSAGSDRITDNERVTVLKMPYNLGFAAGNNQALAKCTGEFVALLNPDAFPAPDWLEKLLQTAAKFNEVAAFGSRQVCYENPKILDGIGDSYHISGIVWRVRHGMYQRSQDLAKNEIFSPCAAAAMYRRSALIDVGGFDEDYFCYVEDVDLGFRMRLAGYKAMYVPHALVGHMGSATTGGQRSNFSVYHGHRNLVWTYIKNMPGILFYVLLPLHLLLNFISIGLFTWRGQFKVILKAKADAIKGIPKVLMKRKEIQSRRVAHIRDIWRALDKQLIPNKK